MAIEGPLKELGIHDVFQLLDLSRKTGALRVTSELRHNQGTIYFEDGTIIFAEIRSNPHPLGALLLRTGKFNEERISDVPTEILVRIPVEALLMEGARRIDEWSRIEGRIPHLGVVASLAPPPPGGGGELDLLPPEWEVLALIDDRRDIRALATELGRSDFDVAKTLFGLESAGVIVLVDPGTAKRGRPTVAGEVAELVAKAEQALHRRDFGAARAAAEQAATTQPHDPVVHLLLGRLHLAQGAPPAAVEELRRALRLDPLLAPAYRQLGYALVALGRFGEALESWEQWERLAARSDEEMAELPNVQRARDAARVFQGMGATHG